MDKKKVIDLYHKRLYLCGGEKEPNKHMLCMEAGSYVNFSRELPLPFILWSTLLAYILSWGE